MSANTYDAIVIGSGISGGWAAKELTQKGLKTIMLERGRNIEHVKDYVNATKAPWDFPHRGGRTTQMSKDYPVLGRDYFLNETNLDYWVNEKESPYVEVKRFDWFRGYHVGGRSLMWGRQSYRWSDLDFEANLTMVSVLTGPFVIRISPRGTATRSNSRGFRAIGMVLMYYLMAIICPLCK